jgi:hypothetical protein
MNNLIQRWKIIQHTSTYSFHFHEDAKFGEFSRNVRTFFQNFSYLSPAGKERQALLARTPANLK